MRMICVFVVTALLGCKDKPTEPVSPTPPPKPGSGSAAPASGSGSGSGSGSATAVRPGEPKSQVVELPKLSGKPPAKTKAKITKPVLEKLSKLEWNDWSRDVRKLDTAFLTVRQTTKTRPKVAVTTAIMPCSALVKCLPLKADKWKAEKDALMVTLAPELRTRPDTTFEIGETQIAGQTAIYVYQLGMYMGKDDVGNMVGAYSHAYILYYHDGTNFIRVVSEYVDDPVADTAHLVRAVSREQLEKVGTAFLDAYTQAWTN